MPRTEREKDGNVASLQTLERRILALEARLADVEGGYGESIYRMHRAVVKNDLRMTRLLDHLKVADVTEDESDAALDEQ